MSEGVTYETGVSTIPDTNPRGSTVPDSDIKI